MELETGALPVRSRESNDLPQVTPEIRAALEPLFAKVSEKVTPTPIEAAVEKRFARKFSEKLEAEFKDAAKVRFVGSTARDTGLKGDTDIDLFVAFPRGRTIESMVKALSQALSVVAPTARWEMHYAEHPYFQAVVEKYHVEVIPCYAISEKERIISAVDRTPLHMTYLQERLSKEQRRDVRVLKKLLKAHGIYGAESEVQGFSGLVCEYLVLNYRDLATLLHHAARWRPPVVLDIENAYDGNLESLVQKYPSPMVLIDFIDATRNAAAAVGLESLSKFVLLARRFLAAPSMEFFFPTRSKESWSVLARAYNARMPMWAVEFAKPPGLVSDILIPQLRRTERSLRRHLELEEFKVHDSASFCGDSSCFILLELEQASAAKLHKVYGPPVYFADDVERFLATHKKVVRGPFVEGGKVAVEVARQLRLPHELLTRIRSDPARYAVASHLVAPFAAARVLEKGKLLKEAQRNKALRKGLSAYLFRGDAFLRS